jgi:hypothetical protein
MRMRFLAVLAVAVVLPACGSSSSTSAPNVAAPPTTTTLPPPGLGQPILRFSLLRGAWHSEARNWRIHLDQRNTALSGRIVRVGNAGEADPGDPSFEIRGTVTGDGTVEFGTPAYNYTFQGKFGFEGTAPRMTGTTHDCRARCRSYGELLVRP